MFLRRLSKNLNKEYTIDTKGKTPFQIFLLSLRDMNEHELKQKIFNFKQLLKPSSDYTWMSIDEIELDPEINPDQNNRIVSRYKIIRAIEEGFMTAGPAKNNKVKLTVAREEAFLLKEAEELNQEFEKIGFMRKRQDENSKETWERIKIRKARLAQFGTITKLEEAYPLYLYLTEMYKRNPEFLQELENKYNDENIYL